MLISTLETYRKHLRSKRSLPWVKAEHDWLFNNYPEGCAGTFISSEYILAILKAFPPSQSTELADLECWQKVKDEWDERNKPTRDGAGQNADQKLPYFPQPIIDKATQLLKSDDWAELAAALIDCCLSCSSLLATSA